MGVDAGPAAPGALLPSWRALESVRPAAQLLVGPHAAFHVKAQPYASWQRFLRSTRRATCLQDLLAQSGSGLLCLLMALDDAEACQHAPSSAVSWQ